MEALESVLLSVIPRVGLSKEKPPHKIKSVSSVQRRVTNVCVLPSPVMLAVGF